VQWTFEDIDSSGGELSHLADFLARKQFDLVINLPMRNGGARRVSSFMTHGYRTRRLAVDYSVPLITDVKCTKMLVLVRVPLLHLSPSCASSFSNTVYAVHLDYTAAAIGTT
jgi:carbamoyl-phosphate synthase/aspartate carbamoyltransferase/dihydroorotase